MCWYRSRSDYSNSLSFETDIFNFISLALDLKGTSESRPSCSNTLLALSKKHTANMTSHQLNVCYFRLDLLKDWIQFPLRHPEYLIWGFFLKYPNSFCVFTAFWPRSRKTVLKCSHSYSPQCWGERRGWLPLPHSLRAYNALLWNGRIKTALVFYEPAWSTS